MKRLFAPLMLLAAIGLTLLLSGGERASSDPTAPGPAVPNVSVARLDAKASSR